MLYGEQGEPSVSAPINQTIIGPRELMSRARESRVQLTKARARTRDMTGGRADRSGRQETGDPPEGG